MRLANNILENYYRAANGLEPWGQLGGMKKLLAKGENGTFWASDFGIKGSEMVGLSYLGVIKDTGIRKEVEFIVERWNGDKVIKKGNVIQWELTDYERLAKAYELIMALINL
jgi:hypothetical protein